MKANTLKILREVNDYTQEYVAEDVLGIGQNTYSRIEKSPSKLTAEQAQKLAELYGVSIPALLSQDPPIITFKDNTISNSTPGAGYIHTQTNAGNDGEIKALKLQLEALTKQNTELMELVKILGGKLTGGNG